MQVEVYADVVKITKSSLGSDRKICVQLQSKTRGVIKHFSRKSRKRLIEQLAQLRNPHNGFFFTMTYPDDVPHTQDKAKRDLATLRKRMLRRFPSAGGIWRLEINPRLSGVRTGELAPHFHVLAFGLPYREPLMRRWLQLAWSRIVYETSNPPRLVRTHCAVIHNRKHASRYAAKYAAKEELPGDQEKFTNFTFGRRWGHFGALDFALAISLVLPAADVVELRRMAARWLHGRGSRFEARLARGSPHNGFAVLGLGDLSTSSSSSSISTIARMLHVLTP